MEIKAVKRRKNEMNVIKILILEMLVIDDEPLNLILREAKPMESNREFIRESYREERISLDEIKSALLELVEDKAIIVVDHQGEKIKNPNMNEILNSTIGWKYWFRITPKGKQLFEDNFAKFLVKEKYISKE